MSDSPHICVICGESLILTDEKVVVVDVLPADEGLIQRVVHKECIDNLRESFRR